VIVVKKCIVRILFSGAPLGTPKWPNITFDPDKRAQELMRILKERYSDFEFVDGRVLKRSEDVKDLLKELGTKGEICTVLFHLASTWFGLSEIFEKLPTVVISDPYLWGYAGMISHSYALRRKGVKGFIVSSSSWHDIDLAFRIIRAYCRLRSSRILVVGRHVLSATKEDMKKALGELGVKIFYADFKELMEEYQKVDIKEAEKLAERLILRADKIVEPKKEDVVSSARMYFALRRLCEKYKANGVTIDCLGGFDRGELPAYPCIAFSLLDDEGEIMTACECDVDSLLTKIVMREIALRPGFICEPAIDTSNNVAIYAHCVAPTRMRGFNEPPESYWIRSHAEDNKGACLQVLMKGGVPVTITKLIPLERKILLLKGELLGHEEAEGGCRTKAIVRVQNAQALIDNWYHNWHRVLFYGDWTRELYWFAKLIGYEIIKEEGSMPF